MSCKVEIDSRRSADDEISSALSQYQHIIEHEVVKKRAEVHTKQNAPVQQAPGGGGFAATNAASAANFNNTNINL